MRGRPKKDREAERLAAEAMLRGLRALPPLTEKDKRRLMQRGVVSPRRAMEEL